MLNIKKKLKLLLLTILMTTTNGWCNTFNKTDGDTIVSVTHSQVKEINVFLLEHDKLLKENTLLKKELSLEQTYSKSCLQDLKIANQKLSVLNTNLKIANDRYLKLESDFKRKKSNLLQWKLGTFTLALGGLVFLLCK